MILFVHKAEVVASVVCTLTKNFDRKGRPSRTRGWRKYVMSAPILNYLRFKIRLVSVTPSSP